VVTAAEVAVEVLLLLLPLLLVVACAWSLVVCCTGCLLLRHKVRERGAGGTVALLFLLVSHEKACSAVNSSSRCK
jgi:hypothetical protein